MFNKTAREAFDDHLKKAESMSVHLGLAADHEFGWAYGLAEYALFTGDITHNESALLFHRVQAARSRRIVRICQEERMAAA